MLADFPSVVAAVECAVAINAGWLIAIKISRGIKGSSFASVFISVMLSLRMPTSSAKRVPGPVDQLVRQHAVKPLPRRNGDHVLLRVVEAAFTADDTRARDRLLGIVGRKVHGQGEGSALVRARLLVMKVIGAAFMTALITGS